MSSEDGVSSSATYQKQTQTSAGPISGGMNSSTRKRSSSHYSSQQQQQQQQQHQQSQHYKENLDRSSNGDYITTHEELHHHQLGTNYNSNASPSRYYSSTDNYILGNRLSTVSQEK